MAIELVAGDKAKGETQRALLACNDYLRMGPGRSLRTLQAQYREVAQSSAPTHALATLNKWSALYGWQARAELYDALAEAEKNAAEKAHQAALAQRRREVMEAGAALDFERVDKLKRLVEFLEAQIFYVGQGDDSAPGDLGGDTLRAALRSVPDPDDPKRKYSNIWARDVKGVGSGDAAQVVEIVRFNAPILAEYRAALDDIAKEAGGRRQRTVTETIDYSKLTDEQLQRVAAGEDPIGVILSDYVPSRPG